MDIPFVYKYAYKPFAVKSFIVSARNEETDLEHRDALLVKELPKAAKAVQSCVRLITIVPKSLTDR